jgi:hypothetical protein
MSYAEPIYSFSCGFDFRRQYSKKRKEKSKLGDVGGPPDQRKRRLSRFTTATATAVEVPSLYDDSISPTPPSQVLALT